MILKDIFNSKEIDNYLVAHWKNIFHSDFIAKRKIHNNVDEKEMPFIIELLNDENKKWFVASYINTVDSFNKELFKKLIEVGVNTPDPSYNSLFIHPCSRVFGCNKVLEELGKLLDKNFENADGILKSIYHVYSLIVSVRQFDADWEQIGLKYLWDSDKGFFDFSPKNPGCKMTSKEFQEYLPTHYEFLERKKNLIVSIKNKTTNKSTIKQADHLILLMEE